MTIILGIISIFLIFAVSIAFAIIMEKKEYNNGKCTWCGRPLRKLGEDSQGESGWACDNCKRYIWLSWVKPEQEED